jgi:conserved oligomeric Golgi complex subunit 7
MSTTNFGSGSEPPKVQYYCPLLIYSKPSSIHMQSKDPRFHALPLTSQRVAVFSDTVNELVYDVLISKVRQRLADVSRMPIWSSVEEPSTLPLPSFSAYPQAYVTSVGEYLLTLPQQLEPLAENVSSGNGNETGNEEAQFFATEWIFKVRQGLIYRFYFLYIF